MNDADNKGKPLRLDSSAPAKSPNLPAFLSKPEGAPVYYGFPLVEESWTDGWRYGTITEFEDPEGCEYGDGFVEAPDGSRAGLVWEVGQGKTSVIQEPEEGRWGVYAIWFDSPVRNVSDLVSNFRKILPDLQNIHDELRKSK
jgi:hypothetical protein